MSTILLDKCMDYVNNFDINDFVYRFYKTSNVQDDYILDKINILRYDFILFWRGLDNNSKIRFVEVINSYDQNKKYKVKFPNNMITIIEEGRIKYILR